MRLRLGVVVLSFLGLAVFAILPCGTWESLAVGAPQGSSAKPVPARWITLAGAKSRDVTMLHFRKEIELEAVPEHFVVDVSADNRFLLMVNQKRVGAGPARGDLAHWRYEAYDLAPYLHAGKNVVAATVWNLGTFAPVAQISNRTGFVVRGEGTQTQLLNTNESWLAEEEPGFGVEAASMAELHGYYAADPIEKIDGRVYDWTWDAESVDASHWKQAQSLGPAAERGIGDTPNNWQLVRDELPPMEWREISSGRVVRTSEGLAATKFPSEPMQIGPNQKVSVLFDEGELTTAYPRLTMSGGKGAQVRFTYAEALKDAAGNKGNRNEIAGKTIQGAYDEYISDGAESRTFSPFVWRTWRYLQIDIETKDEPLRLRWFQSMFSAYPFQERGHFEADDPALASIWKVGWRTARLDAHETYMDTPYWEQLQYAGDTRIQALISYVIAGDDRLARQAIEAFDDSRIPDGITLSRYPTNHFQAIPPFSLMWIGMLHDFAMYRQDEKFVREHLPGTRTVLDWFARHQNENGLLGKLPWWNFVDWMKGFPSGVPAQDENGDSAVITMQFAMALREAAELELAYGEKYRAEQYRQIAGKAEKAVRQLCWNEQYGLIADTPGQKQYSQHANLLAVLLDIIPKPQQRELMTKVLSASDEGFKASGEKPQMETASYYFRFYLARALEHAGMGDRYLELLGPWKNMLALGLTTWAETPEPTRSDSHAWSSHPNYDLLTIVAGIRPTSFGFSKLVLEPHPGNLKNVTAAFPWKESEIHVDYKLANGTWEMRITLPENLPGELLWMDKRYPLHVGLQVVRLPTATGESQ